MLSRSSSSTDSTHQDIVKSIAAVIFLGTPHRGSVDVAAMGEMVRLLVNMLGVETTPVILDALGLKNADMERAQEEFSRLWKEHDFRVKTFQEGLNLTKLGRKVVPEYSSVIGNHREHAETLHADHLEMCRYYGKEDPNYRKVAGEIQSIYLSITTLSRPERQTWPETKLQDSLSRLNISPQSLKYGFYGQEMNHCLQSLWFSTMNKRYASLDGPAQQTCRWLFQHETYKDWLNNRNHENHQGLLWLKGKPGSGKSTLIKEAFRQESKASSSYITAAFFFNGKGDEPEHSVVGLFRSLLYQLISQQPSFLQQFRKALGERNKSRETMMPAPISWEEAEIKTLFESVIMQQPNSRILIFIDALDECESRSIRDLAYFWRKITKSAYASGINLNIFLSSRHFPLVTVSDCPEIVMEQHNSRDITTYLRQRIETAITGQESQCQRLTDMILERSAGVFLWVVLVLDDLLQSLDEGKNIEYLTKRLGNLPQALETLFSQMFTCLSPEKRKITVRLFQWATLSTKPLRLYEWHHIMGFIRNPTPASLAEWRASEYFTANEDQLEKQIRSISLGLVEVTRARVDAPHHTGSEVFAVDVGAGSLNLDVGESRFVQVIHESVRDFFLRGEGFSVLDPSLTLHPVGKGHLSIMATCLDYLNIHELDALVKARCQAAYRKKKQKGQRSRWHYSSRTARHLFGHLRSTRIIHVLKWHYLFEQNNHQGEMKLLAKIS
ncbi:hypothetical protein F53441_8490 [Fusarium austroafricanum]|uniref:Nephrocystin 3-like N-terminal domain-containing protein n=1 Tax=Fusarium austroafricanum TaxID=2364996 RepID=A0A8H4KFF2_9HYPO|nr:hypothetical protein F53441_8490 [Fusarium austroafricanum]